MPGTGIPPFRPDGYLPPGLHLSTEAEVTFRFGSPGRRRRRLALRVRRWIELALEVRALRLLIDGSYVTAKTVPKDVDAVILLPQDFEHQLHAGFPPALELDDMIWSRRPEELFAADDEDEWNAWIEFFSQTREPDSLRKGLVEVLL